jgi:hypothetical protein
MQRKSRKQKHKKFKTADNEDLIQKAKILAGYLATQGAEIERISFKPASVNSSRDPISEKTQ